MDYKNEWLWLCWVFLLLQELVFLLLQELFQIISSSNFCDLLLNI